MKQEKNSTMWEQLISDAIYEITGHRITDYDLHLLSAKCPVRLPDYLYVVSYLENRLSFPVAKVFEKYGYTVFTIHNLAKAIAAEQARLNA